MDTFITFLIATIPALITGVLSYLASRSQTKAKILELNNNYQIEINSINALLVQNERDHKHELDILSKQFELQESKISNDLNTELTSKFINGELDMNKILNNMGPLLKLSSQVNKLNK